MTLVRKPTPPPEPPPPALEMPRTLDEVDGALVDLERERASIQAALAGLPARETELLDADADDAAFMALDIEKKRGDRALERLDRREQQLVKLAERYQAEAQQNSYAEIRQRYIAASEDLAAAAAEVQARIAAVNAISGEATAFSAAQIPALPPVGYSSVGAYMVFGGHLGVLRNQASVAERTPAQVPRLAPRQQTYAVRFLKFTPLGLTAYQKGQIAGFTGTVCRNLVANGCAEWMKPGMQYDAATATFGSGPAPPEDAKRRPAQTDLED